MASRRSLWFKVVQLTLLELLRVRPTSKAQVKSGANLHFRNDTTNHDVTSPSCIPFFFYCSNGRWILKHQGLTLPRSRFRMPIPPHQQQTLSGPSRRASVPKLISCDGRNFLCKHFFLLYEESAEGPMDWLPFVFTAIRRCEAPFRDFNQIRALSIANRDGVGSLSSK